MTKTEISASNDAYAVPDEAGSPILGSVSLSVNDAMQDETINKIGRALSSPDRLKILRLLNLQPLNMVELARELSLPVSSVSFHISVMEEAGLVHVEYQPTLKGHMKLCSIALMELSLAIESPNKAETRRKESSVEMPVGMYTACDAVRALLVGKKGHIFRETNYQSQLFSPERINGELLAFYSGTVTYSFPNLSLEKKYSTEKISFSLEICSEAPYYKNDWPSDLTVWVNGIELTTYTSPGDFGGRRGKYTPDFWKLNCSQFGLMKTFSIDASGCYVDGTLVNNRVTLADLDLTGNRIVFKIGNRADAEHIGGINIFGRNFGDFPQAVVMTLVQSGE